MNNNMDALGHGQLTVLTAAVAISTATIGGVAGIPKGTQIVVLQSETQNVRYRDDGTDPTASVGLILVAGTLVEFSVSQIAQMKVIEAAASAKLNIACYGSRG